MSDSANTKHVMVRMDPDLHDQLKRAADGLDLSMAQAIRASIRRWIKDPSLEEVRPAADRGPCLCPRDDSGPWDPDWNGTLNAAHPACPYHGAVTV